jgi:hypothetical protein
VTTPDVLVTPVDADSDPQAAAEFVESDTESPDTGAPLLFLTVMVSAVALPLAGTDAGFDATVTTYGVPAAFTAVWSRVAVPEDPTIPGGVDVPAPVIVAEIDTKPGVVELM